MKFKIGDEVKIVSQARICGGICKDDFALCEYINKIGTINQIVGEKIGVNKFPGIGKWCSAFDEGSLELVCKDEIFYE